MKFPAPVTLSWIADLIGARIKGEAHHLAEGINEIHRVETGDLVFVDHPKYYKKCIESDASFIIINAEPSFPVEKPLLIVADPFESYQKIVRHFRPFAKATESIDPGTEVGAGTYIAPGVFIGSSVRIGKNCRIHPSVCIMDHCVIGDNVIIQAGTVIGSDAFYYNTKKDREVWYQKMESCGRVVIEDDVEIGANCTIDRGVSHDTRIGRGTKMDNLIHIGHDCTIGKNCLIAAEVGIAGAVDVGDGVVLWGQVGVGKTLRIGDNAVVMGQSGVTGTLEGGKTYMGFPATEASEKRRELVWIKRIPALWEKVMNPFV
jgi:UDP-3-O-[3-hydroxymyristoyl] glucosamine N-acyltransferase